MPGGWTAPRSPPRRGAMRSRRDYAPTKMKSSRAAAMARRRSLSMGTTCISATTSPHWSRPRSNAEEDSPVKDRISMTMLDGGIADVRLIRTDKLNALDPEVSEDLAAGDAQLTATAGLHVSVL